MSELWITFLQKEAESRGDVAGDDGVVSPGGGSEPVTPSPQSKK
jgi:hypothetical protein